MRHAGGRPSKLTEEVKQRLLHAIAAGNYRKAACRYAGIHYNTFLHWMQRGRQQKRGEFRQFWDAIETAEAQLEVRVVATWNKHITESWQAAMHFLARRFPKRWGQKVKTDSKLKLSGTLKSGVVILPQTEMDEEMEAESGPTATLPPK